MLSPALLGGENAIQCAVLSQKYSCFFYYLCYYTPIIYCQKLCVLDVVFPSNVMTNRPALSKTCPPMYRELNAFFCFLGVVFSSNVMINPPALSKTCPPMHRE